MLSLVNEGFSIGLIPLHGIAVATAFVVFQCIGECACIAAECEIVTCVRRKNDLTAHVEAVKITLQTGCRHAECVVFEVITRRKTDVPTVADAQVTAEVQRL